MEMMQQTDRQKSIASAWVTAGAQEFVGALRKTLNTRGAFEHSTSTREGDWRDEPLEKISAELDDAISTAKLRHKMRGIRFGLRGSSAIVRIQSVIDRNIEMSARTNMDQAIDSFLDDRPVKFVPVDHTPDRDRIICVVFRAVPTSFGRFCEKHVYDKTERTLVRRVVRHDFKLIEKHFGVHYDAVPGQRVVVNAAAYVDRVKR